MNSEEMEARCKAYRDQVAEFLQATAPPGVRILFACGDEENSSCVIGNSEMQDPVFMLLALSLSSKVYEHNALKTDSGFYDDAPPPHKGHSH